MLIVLCTLELHIPAASSLKSKRQVLRSVIDRLRADFNIAVAEVAQQDAHQLATLAVVSVSNDRAYLDGLIQRVVTFVEGAHQDLVLLGYEVELL
ncbi:MAG: DUF503 domain-containing protein [Chloroflexi bacterium]|nr:DUF503 domain-containing protein [Chloroflexota bacterium]